jgi:hypothetical protein
LTDIAELLLDQWVDVVVMVMPLPARQILAAHDLRFVSTPLIALMRYSIVG